MEKPHYEPPKQSAFGQLFDSLFLLVLVFAALFTPLYLKLAGGGKTDLALADTKTWEGLGQNAVQQAQWVKLGLTPETAAPMITSRFDYSFSMVNSSSRRSSWSAISRCCSRFQNVNIAKSSKNASAESEIQQ